MTDEQKKEEVKEDKPTTPDTDEGIQSETVTELDRADQIVERQKRENDRREELLTREEALAARRAVGGVTEAGSETVKKEETAVEYKDRISRNDLKDGEG